MKLLTFLLFVALVGQISAQVYPRYVYRTAEVDESSEADDEPQSDEAEVDNDDDEPQADEASEEEEQVKPPRFNKLFPSPKTGRPGSGGAGPTNFAFNTMMHEIDENGWKQPKENPKHSQRSELVAKPVFRDDDDSDEDEEDDAEDDEAYGPDFDTMFPNPEGKQVGPTNMPESQMPFDAPASVSTGGARSGFYQGRRDQGRPMYFTAQSNGRQSVRFVQKPYVRASVTPVRNPSYGYNRRVTQQVQVLPYRRTPSYSFGNRRVVQAPVMAYRQQPSYNMGGNRRPVYNNMGSQRQFGYNMGGYRQQTGPVYVRRQQYVSSPVRRQYVSPMQYGRRPSRQYAQSPYVVRMQRNSRFWNSQ